MLTKKVGKAPTKVLLLHGGFECFEDFLPQNGIEFYYHDQLDSTNSDKPNDPNLWTIDRFRDEVEAVREGLGLEQFYLLGHPWGGMLAIEYALAYPQHLKGLVISNMTARIQAYQKHIAQLRAALPSDVIAVLDKDEKVGDYEAQEYQKAIQKQVYTRHLCRLNPWPEPLQRTFRSGWIARCCGRADSGACLVHETGLGNPNWSHLIMNIANAVDEVFYRAVRLIISIFSIAKSLDSATANGAEICS